MDTNIEELIFPGLIESPADDRDLMLEGIAPSDICYPKAMPAPFALDWRLQGVNPYCVGFGGASLNQQMKARQKVYTAFDGEWGYKQCKLIDGVPNIQGTYLRAMTQVMKNVGFMPVGGGDPANYKIEEYALVNPNIEEVKIALSLYGGILAAFQLSANGWYGDPDTHEVFPPKAGEKTSGHAVMLTHYDENYIWGIDSLKNYHGGQIFKLKFDNYKPTEMRTITLDNKAVASSLAGYVAKDYVVNGLTIARLNLREGMAISSKVFKVLAVGTKVKEYPETLEVVNGILWEYVEVI